MQLEHGLGVHLLACHGVALRVGQVVGLGPVGIDGGLILATLVEEVEGHGRVEVALARHVAHIPVVAVLGLAGDGDVFHGLGLEIEALVPVDGNILDKLEGVAVFLVVLGHVGGHLQRAVEGDVEGQLAAQGAQHLALVACKRAQVHLKDAGRVVHGAALQPGERQNGGVAGLGAAKGLVLGAAGALVAHHVGPGAAQAGGAHGLVTVDHDVVLGSLGHGIVVVVDHPLAVVVLAAGNDVAHIAALDGVVAVAVHQGVGRVEMALVVAHARRGLVVHHELDALAVGIVVEGLQVEVGVGRDKVKHIVLAVAKPVFPALVPALDEELVEAVGSGKVDVAAHVGIVGAVGVVGLELAVVGDAQFHAVHGIGIGPCALAGDHLPPHAHVFHGVYPAGVFNLARLVQVQYQARGQDVAGVVGNLYRAPGRVAGRLHVALLALGVGGEPRLKYHVLVVEVQAHARVVEQGGLVQVDVESVVGLHLQRGLHAGLAELVLRAVGRHRLVKEAAYLAQAAAGVLIFLGVVVAGYPPGHVVARHGKLGVLFLDDKVVQVLLLRELVAQAHAVVVDAEAYHDVAVVFGLVECHGQLVVVVAYRALLAPHGAPRLVVGRCLGLGQREAVVERRLVDMLAARARLVELVAGVLAVEFQPQAALLDGRLVFEKHLIHRYATALDVEGEPDCAAWRAHRLDGLRARREETCHGNCQRCDNV